MNGRGIVRAVVFIILCCVGFFVPTGLAHAAPASTAPPLQYFSVIQDLPLMPGLQELADQAVVFDQPQGRIVESAALSRGPDQPAIKRFYETTLPALGWRAMSARGEGIAYKGMAYIRENEFLQINFERRQGRDVVRIMVGPVP
jgi:hypothetical protein